MKNYRNRELLLYIYISCSLIFISIPLSTAYDIKGESKYYFCNNKLFISDQRISISEIDQMCSRVSNDYRILISIQKDIETTSINSDNYYTRDTEEFFNRQCNRMNRSICDYGFMISIYTNARKIRITAGSISKNVVTIDDRNNIINNIKFQLSRERWAEAVIKAVDLIQSYSYQQPSTPTPNPVYIPPNTNTKSSSGGSFWIIFIFIICPIFLCCVYYMFKKSQETQYVDSAEEVHHYLNKLNHLIEKIRKKSPPIKSTKKCTLCMENIVCSVTQPNVNAFSTTGRDDYYNQMYNPLQQNSPLIQSDPYNTRFLCGHVYHNTCLTECRLNYCLMCINQPNSTITTPNVHNHQLVDENHVRTLISHLQLVYDRTCLQEYARSYPNEFDNYNSSLALGLVGVWGITAVATTAIMMTEMNNHNPNNMYHQDYCNPGYNNGPGYNHDYNMGYNNYNQGYNTGNTGNYDTAGGDFGGGNNQDPDTAEGDF